MNFDTKKYRVWNWKNPVVLHYIINPGFAFTELLLGQRMPRVMLIEKERKKPFAERSFVPCPHCHTMHPGLKWTPQNNTAFGNWFGLYCDHCGKIIPCVINVTSFILLVATFPVWGWFKNRWKKKWLRNQKNKFSQPLALTYPQYKWWYLGIRMAVFMFLFMSVFDFVILQEKFTWVLLLKNAGVWTGAGFLCGILMKSFFNNKKSTETRQTP